MNIKKIIANIIKKYMHKKSRNYFKDEEIELVVPLTDSEIVNRIHNEIKEKLEEEK